MPPTKCVNSRTAACSCSRTMTLPALVRRDTGMAHAHPHPDAEGRAGTRGCESAYGRSPVRRRAHQGRGYTPVPLRVSSILVDNTEHPAAGILTPGSTRTVRLPDIQLVSGVPLDSTLPGHSGGTVPDSHQLPCTAGLRRDYIVGRPTKSRATPVLRRGQLRGGGRDRAPPPPRRARRARPRGRRLPPRGRRRRAPVRRAARARSAGS